MDAYVLAVRGGSLSDLHHHCSRLQGHTLLGGGDEVIACLRGGPGLLDDAVDRFCPAVADAAGYEVGQDLLAPAAQNLAESLDLGDRAGVERVEELLGELAARGLAFGLVDRADLLVDAPGDLNLAIGVTDAGTCRAVRVAGR